MYFIYLNTPKVDKILGGREILLVIWNFIDWFSKDHVAILIQIYKVSRDTQETGSGFFFFSI